MCVDTIPDIAPQVFDVEKDLGIPSVFALPIVHRLAEFSLGDAEKAVNLIVLNPPYGLGAFLGDRLGNEMGVNPEISDAIWEAWNVLLKHMSISGSVVSAAVTPEAQKNLGWNSRLLNRLQRFFRTDIVDRYYKGELDTKNMDPFSYFILKLLLDMRGANIDIQGVDTRKIEGVSEEEVHEDTIEKIRALARFAYTFPFDGKERYVVVVGNYGRIKQVHLEQGDRVSGGINIICLPQKLVEKGDQWMSSTLRRDEQTVLLQRDEKGHVTPSPTSFDRTTSRVEMVVSNWSDLGKWMQHTSKNLRSVVMHEMSEEQLIEESFRRARPINNTDILFESAQRTINDLAAAFFENPDLTMNLIEKTDLNKFLPYYNRDEAQKVSEYYNLRANSQFETQTQHIPWFHPHATPYKPSPDELIEWNSPLENAQVELFGRPKLRQRSVLSNYDDKYWNEEFRSVRDLASVIRLFSPLRLPDLERIIPDPEHRDTVHAYPAGSNALFGFGQPADERIVLDAAQMMMELSDEIRNRNPDAAIKLHKGAAAILTQFKPDYHRTHM